MEYVIEVSGLTKKYSNNRGIENMSFNVAKGEIYGFFGPNGSGKTTLMKILTGLCKADKGQALLFGYDISSQFELAMAQVGCLIETADAYTYMSGYQNLVLAARFYPSLPRKRVDEVLELVGLAPFAKEKVGHYSLGMKQRLGLASALLSSPQLVILDEPTNGMDIEGMVDVRETIIQLAREQGITFFISSHLIREMELMCSRIGIVNQGKFLKEASRSDLLESPHESLEQYFLAQIAEERERVSYV
ncbi:ATP-binding cassette domain-containing protein [Paenibacillus psychroresistens]|uniref:ATP-binding cassette domain-containing protein n=1 Tax=Paenibacillus psychroresistens TaxID=1778678 RepID=A0A6B8RGA6_9BACL|nr:ATP-binding cassette domain-containing protein [Paenibacillus psychroresistens]QGQ95491.1 ATP-binding cassette domain-containing protein [Paenibacillus psychroresistens]